MPLRLLKFKTIYFLTLIAFLLNVTLPFFAVYELPNASHRGAEIAELTKIFGDKILICTTDGYKWVTVEDFASGKEKTSEHAHIKCPICYVANSSFKKFTPELSEKIVYFPKQEKQEYSFLFEANLKSQTFLKARHSRAPPKLQTA